MVVELGKESADYTRLYKVAPGEPDWIYGTAAGSG